MEPSNPQPSSSTSTSSSTSIPTNVGAGGVDDPPPPDLNSQEDDEGNKPRSIVSIAQEVYSEEILKRYKAKPTYNAKIGGMFSNLANRLPKADIPEVIRHYVRSNENYYVTKRHQVGDLLKDAEKLHLEWKAGMDGRSKFEYPEDFNQLWEAYKKGDKGKAFEIYQGMNLSEDEKDSLAKAIENYKKRKPEYQFRKDFENFLRTDWREISGEEEDTYAFLPADDEAQQVQI